jgi:pilus assembly protein CpaE
MDILSQMNSYIVVDCHSSYDERTLVLLDKSDIILLIVTPEIGPLMSASRFLDLVNRLDMHPERIQIVLNRFDSKVGYEKTVIERELKIKVNYFLVSGGREVVMSANKGIPLVMQSPKHPFSLGMIDIAKHLLPEKTVHKE